MNYDVSSHFLLLLDLFEVLYKVLAFFQKPISQWVSNFLVDDRQLSDVGENHDVKLNTIRRENKQKLLDFRSTKSEGESERKARKN